MHSFTVVMGGLFTIRNSSVIHPRNWFRVLYDWPAAYHRNRVIANADSEFTADRSIDRRGYDGVSGVVLVSGPDGKG